MANVSFPARIGRVLRTALYPLTFIAALGLPSPVFPGELPPVPWKVFIGAGESRRPFTGTVYLETVIDPSRPLAAAHRPQVLAVIPVAARAGEIAIPPSPDLRTVRRAFAPGRSSPTIDLPLSRAGGLGPVPEIVLDERKGLEVFRASIVDAATRAPATRARFFFGRRRGRPTLAEQVLGRPQMEPGTTIREATEAGEIFLPTDAEPFGNPSAESITIFDGEHLVATANVRSQLRAAIRGRETAPAVFVLERGATVEGRIGPRHALGGSPAQVRLEGTGPKGREEVRIDLGPDGRLRFVLPPGPYELHHSSGMERIDARAGGTVRIELD
jgi:hypothetical protein